MTDRPSSYPLRMPQEMRKQLELRAERNNRSLQKELLSRMQLSLNLENILKEHLGSVDDLSSKIPELIMMERKALRLQDELSNSKNELKKYQQLYISEVQKNSEGIEGKQRKIEKLKSTLDSCLKDFDELFPST